MDLPALNLPELNLPEFEFRIKQENDKNLIFDEIRKKYVRLTPEEWVRQNIIRYLVEYKHYPGQLMKIEATIANHLIQFRGDVIVYNRQITPVLIVECKAPEVSINEEVFNQVLRYNLKLHVKYLMVTNGLKHHCFQIDAVKNAYQFLSEIPDYRDMG